VKRGRPVAARVAASTSPVGWRLRWESDGAIVPMKPGNAGGGKDPDFWNAFEDGEDRVIGDEPGNTDEDQDLSEEALSQGEGRA
jgi:hypothetical protein